MSFPFLKISFFTKNIFKLDKYSIFLIIIFIILILFGIAYSYFNNDYSENTIFAYFYIAFIMIILIIYYFSLIRDTMKYKKINFIQLNHRPYIYMVCANLKSYYYKMKLVKYLEENIEEVSGEWTKRDILEVNSQPNIRLAKLEEKWLGLSR